MKKIIGFTLGLTLLIACNGTDSNKNTAKTVDHKNNKEVAEVIEQKNEIIETNLTDTLVENTVTENIQNDTESNQDLTDNNITNKGINEVPIVPTETTPKQTEIIENVVKETKVVKPDHIIWSRLLKSNVSSSGKVNYGSMKSNVSLIETYINQLQSFTSLSDLTRNEKLAYWINLYNAATVRLIVQNYPLKSITDINGGKPWDKKVVTIGAKQYTLNQIENDIIRPKFKEPRIHFAVNCAAKSCPKLMNSAFTADKLNYQLTKQAKAFINGSKNQISANKIVISKIFEWYAEDFGSSVIDFINKYSTTKVVASATIEYKEYNWDLNN